MGHRISSHRALILLLLLTAPAPVFAETVFVSSQEAKVYAKANFNSEKIASFQSADEVDVLTREGIWIEVEKKGIRGWISRYSITSAEPFREKVSILTRLKNFFSGDNQRDRLTLVSTAGGIRGLTEEESDEAGKTDFVAVRKMESFAISESELEQFVGETEG